MSKTQNDVSYQKIGLQMCCYVHMEECSSGLKSYKWKKKKKPQQQTKNAKPNQNPQQNKNQTTIPKTANKMTVANASLLVMSLQIHPEYMLCLAPWPSKHMQVYRKN